MAKILVPGAQCVECGDVATCDDANDPYCARCYDDLGSLNYHVSAHDCTGEGPTERYATLEEAGIGAARMEYRMKGGRVRYFITVDCPDRADVDFNGITSEQMETVDLAWHREKRRIEAAKPIDLVAMTKTILGVSS